MDSNVLSVNLKQAKWSESTEIGGFRWTAISNNSCRSHQKKRRCILVSCRPTSESHTQLWNCLIQGLLAVEVGSEGERITLCVWNGAFSSLRTTAHVHYFDFRGQNSEEEGCLKIDIIRSKIADLSSPRNKLLRGINDGFKVIVEGQAMWLSKQVLGCHSDYFHSLFKAENAKIPRLEVNIDELLHFLTLVYQLDTRTDKTTIIYLLKLADEYQCEYVLQRCAEYLENPEAELTRIEKICFADRYKLHRTVMEIVKKATYSQRRQLVEAHRTELSNFTLDFLFEVMSFKLT
ncbi:hypothetical protein L596_028870 [Steinernema carpocapsae]|uniref:BTB domain-containing protein n=1 Tax=Steinernema carpocapsae TaxID=34508 RepID=A0A4U5LZM5_STECR|nr:hypothetical protein L596_028870 [Steinernema carpocapsae]